MPKGRTKYSSVKDKPRGKGKPRIKRGKTKAKKRVKKY